MDLGSTAINPRDAILKDIILCKAALSKWIAEMQQLWRLIDWCFSAETFYEDVRKILLLKHSRVAEKSEGQQELVYGKITKLY